MDLPIARSEADRSGEASDTAHSPAVEPPSSPHGATDVTKTGATTPVADGKDLNARFDEVAVEHTTARLTSAEQAFAERIAQLVADVKAAKLEAARELAVRTLKEAHGIVIEGHGDKRDGVYKPNGEHSGFPRFVSAAGFHLYHSERHSAWLLTDTPTAGDVAKSWVRADDGMMATGPWHTAMVNSEWQTQRITICVLTSAVLVANAENLETMLAAHADADRRVTVAEKKAAALSEQYTSVKAQLTNLQVKSKRQGAQLWAARVELEAAKLKARERDRVVRQLELFQASGILISGHGDERDGVYKSVGTYGGAPRLLNSSGRHLYRVELGGELHWYINSSFTPDKNQTQSWARCESDAFPTAPWFTASDRTTGKWQTQEIAVCILSSTQLAEYAEKEARSAALRHMAAQKNTKQSNMVTADRQEEPRMPPNDPDAAKKKPAMVKATDKAKGAQKINMEKAKAAEELQQKKLKTAEKLKAEKEKEKAKAAGKLKKDKEKAAAKAKAKADKEKALDEIRVATAQEQTKHAGLIKLAPRSVSSFSSRSTAAAADRASSKQEPKKKSLKWNAFQHAHAGEGKRADWSAKGDRGALNKSYHAQKPAVSTSSTWAGKSRDAWPSDSSSTRASNSRAATAARCKDGSRDMRFSANRGHSKYDNNSNNSDDDGDGGVDGITTSSSNYRTCIDGSRDMRCSENKGHSKYGTDSDDDDNGGGPSSYSYSGYSGYSSDDSDDDRHRCNDGSLDMRYSENFGCDKYND